MTLVDTSVWVAYLRPQHPIDLEALVPFREIVTCLPVVQEVLQGIRDEGLFRRTREFLWSLPALEAPLEGEIVLEAVDLYRAARRRGITPRSSVDCLIAACAIRHEAEILHLDRDFASLAGISALRQRRASYAS